MSWIKAVDSTLDYWHEVIPDIASICISRDLEIAVKQSESSLQSEDLCPEPRSVHSSEFSERSSEKKSTIWTAAEDKTLLTQAVNKNYHWAEISKFFPNTSAHIVEQRWKMLNENKAKIDWTKEQDRLILKLYQAHGGHWKKIATFFPGISSSTIKNRFYGSIKRKINGSSKGADFKSDGNFGIDIKQLTDLSDAEKRSEIQKLYQRLFEIQNNIESAKGQIKDLANKNKKSDGMESPKVRLSK